MLELSGEQLAEVYSKKVAHSEGSEHGCAPHNTSTTTGYKLPELTLHIEPKLNLCAPRPGEREEFQ